MSGFDLVIGLGITGRSCLRYLVAQGESVQALDTRASLPDGAALAKQFPTVPMHFGGFREDLLEQARRLIVSPGVALAEPAIAKQIASGKEVVGDIELFCRAASQPVAAISGSNAKSTVTTLLGEVAIACGKQALMGGNLGVPALDLLEQGGDLYVLELSSFQLESTWSLNADVATILNVSEDHLDRYASINDYIAAKQRIYDGCRVAVWNRDDLATKPQAMVPAQITFGVHSEADYQLTANGELLRRGELLLRAAELQLRGHHNLLNVLAVLAMAEALNLPLQPALAAIKAFRGLPHRCELIAEQQGVQWVNDSKGTNVGATQAALKGIAPVITGRIILLAGGQGKGQDFSPLADNTEHIRQVILFGEDADKVAAVFPSEKIVYVADLKAAVSQAHKMAQAGDAVLLSPACASLDMFRNYAERGDVFAAAVREVLHVQ